MSGGMLRCESVHPCCAAAPGLTTSVAQGALGSAAGGRHAWVVVGAAEALAGRASQHAHGARRRRRAGPYHADG